MKKITAICELADQACGIEDVRIIDNSTESMQAYEDEWDDKMWGFGYRIYFYDAIYSRPDEYEYEHYIYEWMDLNRDKEID